MDKIKIAIIGRPNVGKSTLFNRIIGKKIAIVEDKPGITRDRNYKESSYKNKEFILVDTGGLDSDKNSDMLNKVRAQVEIAIEEADLIIFLMDGREGLNPIDRDIINDLRGINKPIFYTVNKIDNPKDDQLINEFFKLGTDKIFPVSSEQGLGIYELLDEIYPYLTTTKEESTSLEYPKIAVLGRPNVGKSTLINSLLGSERLITSEIPGTTRDSIDTLVEYKGRKYLFIDTAGIRRRGKIERGVESYSVMRANRSLDKADIALLILDGNEGITEQDTKISGQIIDRGKGCLKIINKCDLLEMSRKKKEDFESEINFNFKFLDYAPSLFISAKESTGLNKIYQQIDLIMASYTKRISTADLNKIFEKITDEFPAPLYHKKAVKTFYATQIGTKPPTFVVFVNKPEGISPTYQRYLENSIRRETEMIGIPLRILIRKKR